MSAGSTTAGMTISVAGAVLQKVRYPPCDFKRSGRHTEPRRRALSGSLPTLNRWKTRRLQFGFVKALIVFFHERERVVESAPGVVEAPRLREGIAEDGEIIYVS